MLLQLRNKQLHDVSLNKEEVKIVTLLKGKKKSPPAAKIPKPFTALLACAIEGSTKKKTKTKNPTPQQPHDTALKAELLAHGRLFLLTNKNT